ncbi:MAG TPA: hypothetical protein VHP38_08095, partial [Ruminiclostridium sp.]|nr:hypothetical protein [Ruminiclostridium sp.]
MPAHQVEQLKGWKVKWQVFNTAIAYTENGPYMQANNGKIFYMGSLGNEPINRIIALNAVDGSLAIKTDPIETNMEFLVDDSALYIGKFISEIAKYDLVTQKQVWTQTLGNSHAPCCFSVVNHQLQSNWYSSRFYIQSIEDGEIIREMKDTQKRIYRIENGITYSGGSGFLTAQNADQSVLWETELKAFSQPPVFTKDAIYVRA